MTLVGNSSSPTPTRRCNLRRLPSRRVTLRGCGSIGGRRAFDGAKCYVEWTTKEQPKFSNDRRVFFTPATDSDFAAHRETRTMIRMYKLTGWKGIITGLRIGFANAGKAQVIIKSFHTASDTRHSVNNLNFIRGCHDYFLWTRDVIFLRDQIGRIRLAMQFIKHKFQAREKKCIYMTWPGHEGRSGVRIVDGKKNVLPGEGVGSDYLLVPFGGEDALATVYYYNALHRFGRVGRTNRRSPRMASFQKRRLRSVRIEAVRGRSEGLLRQAFLERSDRPIWHSRSQ